MAIQMEVSAENGGRSASTPDSAASSQWRPRFLITIDTEGDNIWHRPRETKTENARYLPRFQELCERHGFKPVYLTNYEMAIDPVFVEFGRDAIRRGTAEIGMHLHAWNSPPVVPLTEDDHRHQPFLVEYPEALLKEKAERMTGLLEDTFQVKMKSHRAGRWAFNGVYARTLVDLGYEVDCSVTPGVNWRTTSGAPQGSGGTDYRGFPSQPYFLDLQDIRRAGTSPLLEIPMTIRSSWIHRNFSAAYRIPALRSLVWRISPPQRWLRPGGGNVHDMISLVREAAQGNEPCVEFMLHSSELMPGGSPTFPNSEAIDNLYREMDTLFCEAASCFSGATLAEFARAWRASHLSDREGVRQDVAGRG